MCMWEGGSGGGRERERESTEYRSVSMVYVCMIYTYGGLHVPMHTRGQGKSVGTLIYHSLPYVFEAQFLANPEARLEASKLLKSSCLHLPQDRGYRGLWPQVVFKSTGTWFRTQVLTFAQQVLLNLFSSPHNLQFKNNTMSWDTWREKLLKYLNKLYGVLFTTGWAVPGKIVGSRLDLQFEFFKTKTIMVTHTEGCSGYLQQASVVSREMAVKWWGSSQNL